MDLGNKITAIENQIYDLAVGILQNEEIPSTVGRMIMDGVYRRFVESAYYVSLQQEAILEQEVLTLREKLKENKSNETPGEEDKDDNS